MSVAKKTNGPMSLLRLIRALRRRGNRLINILDGGARQRKQAAREAEQRRLWRTAAQTRFQANAAVMQSDKHVLSSLEEMIAARIGRPVRHVRSEAVLRLGDDGSRPHLHRRAHTKHWFEVSGVVDEKLTSLCDADGLLGVFVKSATNLRVSPPLESILSEQGGNGFRVPYFFGLFTVSDLKVGAWQAIDTELVQFSKQNFAKQKRIVEAVAAVNAVPVERSMVVRTRSAAFDPRKFRSKFRFVNNTGNDRWRALYARTADLMNHHAALVRRLQSADERFLAHGDINGSNLVVPPAGDVVIFDWERSTLSAPGADLAVLAGSPAGADLVSCYVFKMAQLGIELNADEVRFALDVTEGFRLLHSGWRRQSEERVEAGLALLCSHI